VDDLVEDYLSLVRGSALQQTPMELSMLVTQCAQEIRPALAAHSITLHLYKRQVVLSDYIGYPPRVLSGRMLS
jgi:hypothetical protein